MRQQRRSETFRNGEPQSHIDSANAICRYARSMKYDYRKDYPIKCCAYYHEYDIVLFKEKDLRMGFGYTNDYLTTKVTSKHILDGLITHVIEVGDIGDDSKHNPGHKEQLIADAVAKYFAQIHFPQAKFVRINKDDCFELIELKERIGL